MPVLTTTLSSTILSQLTGKGLIGTHNANLANAVAQGTKGYLSSLVVQGTAVGTLGAGTGIGKLTLDPLSGTQLISAALVGAGLPGQNIPKMANAIAVGIASVVNSTAVVNTVVTGVAVGAETGVFTNPNPSLASSLMFTGLASNAIVGPSASNLAQGLGLGISQWFQTGIITTAVAGSPIFPFNATTGIGLGSVQ